MHSHTSDNDFAFNYNSDFSGDVIITKITTGESIEVPGQDILEFVAFSYILPKRIAAAENLTLSELLS